MAQNWGPYPLKGLKYRANPKIEKYIYIYIYVYIYIFVYEHAYIVCRLARTGHCVFGLVSGSWQVVLPAKQIEETLQGALGERERERGWSRPIG